MNLQRHLPLLGLVAVALVLLVGVLTQSDNPDLLRFEVDGERAYGEGFTDGRSHATIRKLVRDNPQVTTLVFRDMPGTQDLVANQRLAREIRKQGLATHLEADSYIASGAVTLFIAGTKRTAECGARVGVHAWGVGGADVDAQNALMDNYRGFSRDFLSDMGLDPDFYDFRINAARADGIHIMSPEELERWRVVTEPMDCG